MTTKIPINLLLNPQQHDDKKEKKDKSESCSKLRGTRVTQHKREADELFFKLSNGIGKPEFELRCELKKVLSSLKVVTTNGKLEENGELLLRTTFQLSKTLSVVLSEFKKVEESNIQFHKSRDWDSERKETNLRCKVPNFEIVPLNTKQDYSTGKRHRGHRLPSEKVEKLELWFNQNISKPYLNQRALRTLVHETSLSPIQIKNWLSNRRRKKKSAGIADTISDLLFTKKNSKTDTKV
ncbi:homeodomain mating type protein alpha2 TDEL_0C07000 [Torulaspora delbrueckii]|uniref:Homeobox domain-containing protein n=1 Tax=Torulaspora delbrueckii TaxID=4950 RepID=G8ZQV2_TORDE|nr:hypothetical protein TDEL_0C07000 [Torulaspora delbrueckii]CCE91589.1 hypothetical protein TDEL_0C07000 [Torulaspora delbrueckii]